jgi:hypothetical protein
MRQEQVFSWVVAFAIGALLWAGVIWVIVRIF